MDMDKNGVGAVDLLELTTAGGCGCKLPLDVMGPFMTSLQELIGATPVSEAVKADSSQRDDAALYEISPGRLLAVTADFGTPVSSDAKVWGRIAAQNALSDVYAMGARPLLALSLLALPRHLGLDVMSDLTAAAVATLTESATPLVGGHTVVSEVPMFGLCVVGEVSAGKALMLGNARPGHVLILTKALGTGIVTAGRRAGVASPALVRTAEELMSASNRAAADAAVRSGIRAATDVTGFGLIGHLLNMLSASGCAAVVNARAVPVMAGVADLLDTHGVVPNSGERNMFTVEDRTTWSNVDVGMRLILSDAQTSGGLLLAADASAAEMFMAASARDGIPASFIGAVTDGPAGTLEVRG
ncbi:selenide, water dikinase SelD [Streptomyces rubiginosohelvolus]|uniref:selenide, water dikinase SelD n=1 Tax=Streptomyces rubiginosohelvolus TaxID=67362 RepID=UPI003652ADC7